MRQLSEVNDYLLHEAKAMLRIRVRVGGLLVVNANSFDKGKEILLLILNRGDLVHFLKDRLRKMIDLRGQYNKRRRSRYTLSKKKVWTRVDR